jgi:chemotaxis family two-component system sensor kinase Cph1
MPFKRGDHACAVYSTPAELTRTVAAFLTDGLQASERCWYVGAGHELASVRAALIAAGIDPEAATRRGALQLLSGEAAYVVRGAFDPIEQAYIDGFAGFRAAAEMSWALDCADGGHQVIVYEALLKSLFDNCRAIGLCLYDREKMPLGILQGALATHPVAGSHGSLGVNPFYDPAGVGSTPVRDADVLAKLAHLDRLGGSQ